MPAAELTIPGDPAVRAQVHEVLARPRYANFRLDPNVWLQKAQRWFGDLLSWATNLHHDHPERYWLLLGACTLVTLGLIAHMAYSLRAAIRSRPATPAVDAPQQGVDFLAEARDFAKRQAFLEAAHQMLLGSLRSLAAGRHIELSSDDTNATVCNRLARSELPQELRTQLVALIQHTEREWFGAGRSDAALYERWCEAFRLLQSQPARRKARPA